MTDGGAVSPDDYRAAISALAARTTQGVRLGLDRTRELLQACGSPHETLRAFHLAGTNGKGSTCATIDAVLQTMGFRVGRYTSPHLIDFRERLLINGAPVHESDVMTWLKAHQHDIDHLGATFFEATTAMAFDLFVQAGVDVAVVEVGLGGRLDSTNVITPLVAAVTSIALDHREYLGDTLTEIAIEKAGIFKAGVPAVIGERDPAIIETLVAAAHRAGASRVDVAPHLLPTRSVELTSDGTAVHFNDGGHDLALKSSLLGVHQAQNLATAISVLRAAGGVYLPSHERLERGAFATRLAGRFQRVGRWIFDVAHNPDGIATVVESIRAVVPVRPLAAVVCVLSDKDWRGMLDRLMPELDRLVLTHAPTAPASRQWPLDEVLAYAKANAGTRCEVCAEVDFGVALERSQGDAATVLVTGSFHTVGDAMQRLQIDPLNG